MHPLELVARLVDNTYNPVSKDGTYSIKTALQGNRLVIKFQTIVHFASEQSLRLQSQTARDHGHQLIKQTLDSLKKNYKSESGEALKFDDKGSDDNVEIIQSTSNSLRKIAYYRLNHTVDLDL